MRFMIMVRATPDTEAAWFPEGKAKQQLFQSMADYHDELAKAGVLLDASGLQPSSKGWRIGYGAGAPKVIDGPFAESKELIAGYTLIECRSREEALEWSRRFPNPMPGRGPCEVEVRQLYELEDLEAIAGPLDAVEQFRKLDLR